MKSISQIKEYCSWNNIPYKEINLTTCDKNLIRNDEGIKLVFDLSDLIGGTKEALIKFIEENE